MLEKIVSAAVKRVRRDDVLPLVGEGLHRVRHRRRAGRQRQRRRAALQRREATLQNVLRRVRQTTVNVARVAQTETIRRVLEIVEHIRRRLVNRHRARVRNRVRLLLSNVELKRLKFVLSFVCHDKFPLLIIFSNSYMFDMF